MISIGIDPGLRGGLVALYPDAPPEAHVMPVLSYQVRGKNRREMDLYSVCDWLTGMRLTYGSGGLSVAIERQQAYRGQGLSSTAKTMRAYGQLEGICQGLGLSYLLPRPQEWQELLDGTPGEGKGRSIAWCQKHLPDLDLTPGRLRVPHDGLADAACIAAWALTAEVPLFGVRS